MPKIVPVEAGFTQQQLEKSASFSYATHERSDLKIKDEAADEPGMPPLETDWMKTYECVLSTIASPKSALRFGRDATKVLQQLEPALQVATSLEVISTMKSLFQNHILEWIGNKTLYQAIADQPPSWLLVGLKLRQNLIYKEAFAHLAGNYPNWPWSRPKDTLPPTVLASIETHSKDLRTLRDRIDTELLLLWPVKNNLFVTQNTAPPEFFTASRFLAWFREHLMLLRQDEVGLPAATDSSIAAGKSLICDHSASCRTVGGFYRTIARGGDAYLPADEAAVSIMKGTGYSNKESVVRKCLADLKAQAAKIVAPLVKSATQFSHVDRVVYLTCVEVREEDMPWSEEHNEGSEDGEEDMEG